MKEERHGERRRTARDVADLDNVGLDERQVRLRSPLDPPDGPQKRPLVVDLQERRTRVSAKGRKKEDASQTQLTGMPGPPKYMSSPSFSTGRVASSDASRRRATCICKAAAQSEKRGLVGSTRSGETRSPLRAAVPNAMAGVSASEQPQTDRAGGTHDMSRGPKPSARPGSRRPAGRPPCRRHTASRAAAATPPIRGRQSTR